MKRIAFGLICGLLLLISNTAEARRARWNNSVSYAPVAQAAPVTTTSATVTSATVTPASYSESVDSSDSANRFSTRTAQGVANIMAANNTVGHWGGNPGYEGCGCGASKEAAYSICCYGNSGMATVDVGYAQSANGMWYCCRRYR